MPQPRRRRSVAQRSSVGRCVRRDDAPSTSWRPLPEGARRDRGPAQRRSRGAGRRPDQDVRRRATPASPPSTTSAWTSRAAEFTAIMGPSGLRQVDPDALHGRARHADRRAGSCIDGVDARRRSRTSALTRLRRDRLGFVFQSFNLVPTLTARENITLPLDIAGRQARPGLVRHGHRHGRPAATGSATGPTELSGGQQQRVAVRPGAGQPAGDRLRRRADRQPRLARRRRDARLPAPLGRRVRPDHRDGHPRPDRRRRYADRVLFLADGRIVDEMRRPDRRQVLERMKGFELAGRRG